MTLKYLKIRRTTEDQRETSSSDHQATKSEKSDWHNLMELSYSMNSPQPGPNWSSVLTRLPALSSAWKRAVLPAELLHDDEWVDGTLSKNSCMWNFIFSVRDRKERNQRDPFLKSCQCDRKSVSFQIFTETRPSFNIIYVWWVKFHIYTLTIIEVIDRCGCCSALVQ